MVITYDSNLHKIADETESEYVQRICATKDINKLSWKRVAEHLNKQLNLNYSESYYRKNYQSGTFAKASFPAETETSVSAECEGNCGSCDNLTECLTVWKAELDDQEQAINEKICNLAQLRVKLADERSQNANYVRRLSREDSIREIAHDYAVEMSKSRRLPLMVNNSKYTDESVKEGILLLSDWHYGMECNNSWNTYNTDVCRKRVSKLLSKVRKIIQDNKLKKVTILNLSDLIAGRIHSQIRIESRIDVITQTMEVAELLAEFINCLSAHCSIDYYDCLDNHSRLEPDKKESLDLESLVRIISWYLKERLSHNSCIKICDNEFGQDIITCKILGHNVIGVHGDNDRPTNALDKLSLMTHRHYDMLCTAHLHHFNADEQHQSVVISNSSLMGVDSYAEKLRLTSDPSQTFIIASEDNVCECIYRIVLK